MRARKKKKYLANLRIHGQVLVFAVIIMTVALILAASLFTRTTDFLRFGSSGITQEQASSLAEAGIDRALWQLNKTAGSYTGETNTPLGTTGTFTVAVTNKSSSLKTITATGFVPDAASPRSKRTIKVDVAIDNTIIAFNFAVQVGTGGVIMHNSSQINGGVYSNADISGTGPSTITGDAYAVGNITSPPTVFGKTKTNQPPSQMPALDYQSWKDQANINNDSITCSPTCTISNNTTIGPRKYIGNLTLSNNAIVTLEGPVYVTGNFTMVNGNTTLKLDDSFGSRGTVLLVDGIIDLSNGGMVSPTNANPKGYIIVATTSAASPAITISQTGATAIFYALNGGAQLQNSAQVSALISKSLTMQNGAELFYDQGLASSSFTSGPGGSWQVIKGTYKYSQ